MDVLALRKKGAASNTLFWKYSYASPWSAFEPDLVISATCAPELALCVASYIAVLTRTSCSVSTGGVGRPWPIASYTEVLVATKPAVFDPCPVFSVKRLDDTWLPDLPLNRLLALIPLSTKLLEESRWPLAQMA